MSGASRQRGQAPGPPPDEADVRQRVVRALAEWLLEEEQRAEEIKRLRRPQ